MPALKVRTGGLALPPNPDSPMTTSTLSQGGAESTTSKLALLPPSTRFRLVGSVTIPLARTERDEPPRMAPGR